MDTKKTEKEAKILLIIFVCFVIVSFITAIFA